MEPDEEPFDPIPAQIAALDQLKKSAPIQAEAMWSVYSAWVDVGFDDEQAFQVVLFFLGATMFNNSDGDDE